MRKSNVFLSLSRPCEGAAFCFFAHGCLILCVKVPHSQKLENVHDFKSICEWTTNCIPVFVRMLRFQCACVVAILEVKHVCFYRTQVSLGSGLRVPVSLCHYIRELCETLLMWLWLMMIPTQYYWWCQYKTIPGYSYSMTYMQVALADGQSKIVGTLEVNWNINLIINLITRNKGIQTLPEAQRTQGIESITQIIPNGK